jgi:hypothetical protein
MSSESARLVEERMAGLFACHVSVAKMIEGQADPRLSTSDFAYALLAIPADLRDLVAQAAAAIESHLGDRLQADARHRISQLVKRDGQWQLVIVAERYVQAARSGWKPATALPSIEVEMADGARFELLTLLSALRVGRMPTVVFPHAE